MKNFDRERAKIEQEAVAFLRSGLFAENPERCGCDFLFGIQAADKDLWPEEYRRGLLCFHALFRSGEERHRIALWNMLTEFFTAETKICEEDFSGEERAFIQKALRAAETPFGEANVNPPIQAERVRLRAIEKPDRNIFAAHFLRDGDAVPRMGLNPAEKRAPEFAVRLRRSAFFAVERRADRELIGYAGLDVLKNSATGLLEYYIFKEERGKGYCKEAVKSLIGRIWERRLYEPAETVQNCVYRRKTVALNVLRARIPSDNTAARRVAEECGFAHEATIHETLKRGAGFADEEIYYLTREAYFQKKKTC